MFVVSKQASHFPWHYTETPTWKAVFLGWTNRVSGEPIGFAGNAERALGTPRGDRKYAQSSDATGDRSATLCIRRGKERMARMCSGTPHPGHFCKRVRKLLKTKEASAKKSDKRVKERANY